MLTDAKMYMDVLNEIDEHLENMAKAIFDPKRPDDVVHDLRVRRKQLTDVRDLITGATQQLPHS